MFRLLIGLLLVLGADVGWMPPVAAAGQQAAADPDQLYDAREEVSSALAAADAWAARLAADSGDFEAAWKLARAAYWLGSHVSPSEQRRHYERGLEAGRRAIAINPNRPEGRFWMAATMGAMAESFGLRAGIQYRGPVKREFEAVLRIDPAYSDGAADRGLGRWYFRVPGLFGGSKRKAIEHLVRSLMYDPTNAASHFFLAETYISMNRIEDGRVELQRVLEAPETLEWGPETREFKQRARVLLARLTKS